MSLPGARRVAQIGRRRGILTAADNTFATPWNQRPLECGFDLVVHSTTKYLNGHSDMVGGTVVVGGNAALREREASTYDRYNTQTQALTQRLNGRGQTSSHQQLCLTNSPLRLIVA